MYSMYESGEENHEGEHALPHNHGVLDLIAHGKLKWAVLGVSVISLILVLSTGAYYFLDLKKYALFSKAPRATVTPALLEKNQETLQEDAPVAAIENATDGEKDKTADWKLYSNIRAGYSLKYPPTWAAKSYGQTDETTIDFAAFNPDEVIDNKTTAVRISYTTRSYDEALKLSTAESKKITVGGVVGAKKEIQDSQKNKFISVILPLDDNSITLTAKQEFEDEFNNILSTFKFSN